LIGKALLQELQNTSNWARLSNRIVNLTKRIFYQLKGDEIKLAILDANKQAAEITQNFTSHTFNGTVSEALKTKETRYSSFEPAKIQFEKLFLNLEQCARLLKPLNFKRSKKLQEVLKIMATKNSHLSNSDLIAQALEKQQCLEGIAVGCLECLNQLVTLQEDLTKIDLQNNFIYEGEKYARSLRSAQLLISTISQIYNDLNTVINSASSNSIASEELRQINILTKEGIEAIDINKLLSAINSYIFAKGGLQDQLGKVEAAFALKQSEDILGSSLIVRGKRLVFKSKFRDKNGKFKFRPHLEMQEEKPIYVAEMLEMLENDINSVNTYALSASVAPDIMIQIFNKAIQQAHRAKTLMTNGDIDHLRKLFLDLREATGSQDTSWCFETFIDEYGNHTKEHTGNLIMIESVDFNTDPMTIIPNTKETCLNYGMWERSWEEYKNSILKKFDEDNKNNTQISPTVLR